MYLLPGLLAHREGEGRREYERKKRELVEDQC